MSEEPSIGAVGRSRVLRPGAPQIDMNNTTLQEGVSGGDVTVRAYAMRKGANDVAREGEGARTRPIR